MAQEDNKGHELVQEDRMDLELQPTPMVPEPMSVTSGTEPPVIPVVPDVHINTDARHSSTLDDPGGERTSSQHVQE